MTSDGSAVLEALHGLPFTPALPLSPNPNPNPNLNPNPYPNPNPNPNPNETLALTLTVTVTRSSTACLEARQLAKAELRPSPELDTVWEGWELETNTSIYVYWPAGHNEATNRVYIIAARLPIFPPLEQTLSLDSHIGE